MVEIPRRLMSRPAGSQARTPGSLKKWHGVPPGASSLRREAGVERAAEVDDLTKTVTCGGYFQTTPSSILF